MRDFIAYAQFLPFWERLQPETPFGRAMKESMEIHRDSEALERIWDETEVALGLLARLEDDRVGLSRILHHLKRLPRFCEEPRAIYDEVEIFQFKKFLHNYKNLTTLLGPTACQCFQLEYDSEALEQRLDTGRQSAESFYVSDAFSEDLARVRREIRETDGALKLQQQLRSAEIQERWKVDFGSRAFLLMPRQALGAVDAASDLLLVEPYDEDKYVIRPRCTVEELLLQERRASLLSAERGCELGVLESLSACLREALSRFSHYREAITRFDLAFARARLAREYHLVRPVIHSGPLAIQGGRFIPCEESCQALGTDYVALDGRFDTPATVLFGSNMGGKTVVLKTLAFLQLCAQTGLFVPAQGLSTRLFQHFHYLGEGHAQEVAQGLSGFGFEIRQLVEASADFQVPTLVLFDEFARTTSSLEAEAILSAVLESLQAKPDVMAFFSTHFRGVRRLSGVRYLRMKGLNRQGLDLDLTSDKALKERIRLIDQRMEYHLVTDEGGADVSDAIAVAGLLGLDPAIAHRAAEFFKNGH